MSNRDSSDREPDENVEPEAPDQTQDEDEAADERSEESFPASDPPAW